MCYIPLNNTHAHVQLAIAITSLWRAEMRAVLTYEEKRIPEGRIGNFKSIMCLSL